MNFCWMCQCLCIVCMLLDCGIIQLRFDDINDSKWKFFDLKLCIQWSNVAFSWFLVQNRWWNEILKQSNNPYGLIIDDIFKSNFGSIPQSVRFEFILDTYSRSNWSFEIGEFVNTYKKNIHRLFKCDQIY